MKDRQKYVFGSIIDLANGETRKQLGHTNHRAKFHSLTNLKNFFSQNEAKKVRKEKREMPGRVFDIRNDVNDPKCPKKMSYECPRFGGNLPDEMQLKIASISLTLKLSFHREALHYV